MRTGHIITRNSKGSKLGFDGVFSKAKEIFETASVESGETIELWSSDGKTKVKKGSAKSESKSK